MATVTKLTIGRLHNLGNYEHVRYEVTVELAEGDDIAKTLANTEAVLDNLEPKEPHDEWAVRRAQEALNKPAKELGPYELENLESQKKILEECRAHRAKRKAAHDALKDLAVSEIYKDAKDEWDFD